MYMFRHFILPFVAMHSLAVEHWNSMWMYKVRIPFTPIVNYLQEVTKVLSSVFPMLKQIFKTIKTILQLTDTYLHGSKVVPIQ
jgi:hypothetical protein